MKKIPLDPEHRAGQKKIRKMLAAGLPLAALLSGLAAGCDLRPGPVGIAPREPDDSEDVRPPGEMPMNKEPRQSKTPGPSRSESLPPPRTIGEPPPRTVGKPLPPAAVHVVKKGDTLAAIARQYGTTTAELKKLNGLTGEQADRLKPGQQIKLK